MQNKSDTFGLFKTILTNNAIQLLEDPQQLPKHRKAEDIPADLQMLLADTNIMLFRHYPDMSVTPGIIDCKESVMTQIFSDLAKTLYEEKKDTKRTGQSKLKKPSSIEDHELATALAKSMAELYRVQPFDVGNSETIFAFAQIVAGSVGRHLGFDRMPPIESTKFISQLEQCAIVPATRPIPEEKLSALTDTITTAIVKSKQQRPLVPSAGGQMEATNAGFNDNLWQSDTSRRWEKDEGLLIHDVDTPKGKVPCLVTIDGQYVPAAFVKEIAERKDKDERDFRLKEEYVPIIQKRYGIETRIPASDRIDGISLKNGVPLLKLDEDLLTGIPLKKLHELEDEARHHGWIENLQDPYKLQDFVRMLDATEKHDVEKRFGLKKDDVEWLEKAARRLKNGMLAKIDQYVRDSLVHNHEGATIKATTSADPKALVVTGVESGNDQKHAGLLAHEHSGDAGFITISDRAMLSRLKHMDTLAQLAYRPNETETVPYPFATRLLRTIRNKQLQFIKDSHCYNIYAETGISLDRIGTEELLHSLKKTGADIDVVSLMKPVEEIAQRKATVKTRTGLSDPMAFLLLSSRASRNQFMDISAMQTTADIHVPGENYIPKGSYVVDKHTGLCLQGDGNYKPLTMVGDGRQLPETRPEGAVVIPVRSDTPEQHGKSMVIYDPAMFARYIAHGTRLNANARNTHELFVDSEAEGLLNVAIGAQVIENTLKRLRAEQHIKMGNELLGKTIDGVSALKDALNDPDALGNEFVRAVEMIRDAKGRVLISGVGKSLRVGELLAASLGSLGIPCDTIDPTHGVHGDLGKVDLNAGNLLIAISKSGNSQELQPVVTTARKRGLQVISVTHKEDSFLGQSAKEAGNSGVLLKIPDTGEPAPFHETDHKVSPPTVSTTQVKALIEAIALAVAQSKGMKVSDFGEHHPAGALGKASSAPSSPASR